MPQNKVGDPLFITRKVRILDQTVLNVSLKNRYTKTVFVCLVQAFKVQIK